MWDHIVHVEIDSPANEESVIVDHGRPGVVSQVLSDAETDYFLGWMVVEVHEGLASGVMAENEEFVVEESFSVLDGSAVVF